jgi:MSHA biogenesis protein MshJ
LNDELTAVKIRIEALGQSIAWSTTGPVDAQPLAQVLVHLLRRYEGLTLVSTTSIAAELDDKKMPVDAATALPPGFTRQGLALTVSGPYSQLLAYVQTLEAAMPHVRWGPMRLNSEKQPPELKLHLFIVGVTP